MDEFNTRPPSRKFQRIDALVLGLGVIAGIFETLTDAFESATILAAMHANYNVDQDYFRRAAALEIETITGEPE